MTSATLAWLTSTPAGYGGWAAWDFIRMIGKLAETGRGRSEAA